MRPGALAGFVRVDTALDAPADRRSDAGHGREGIRYDQADNTGQFADVQDDDADRQHDIGERHERHDDLGYVRDALDAAKNDDAQDGGDRQPGDELRDRHRPGKGIDDFIAAEGKLGRVGNGVRLDPGQQKAAGDDRGNREDPGVPLLAQRFFDVIRGSPSILTFVNFLVDLSQRRLDVGRRRAQQGDDPHPENGTRPAKADGGSDPGDVAGTYTSGQGNGQCLEG